MKKSIMSGTEMQKIILDTNVIISALISSNGLPGFIVSDLVLEKKVQVCISDEIINEYFEVIKRPKFSNYKFFLINAELVINYLVEFSTKFSPPHKVHLIKDESDNKFLELALESKADILITGNTNDFKLDTIGKTSIVSPTKYWNQFRPK